MAATDQMPDQTKLLPRGHTYMVRENLTRPWRKTIRSVQHQELVVRAMEMKGGSVALACRAFGIRKIFYRYTPKLDKDNADLLLGPTTSAWPPPGKSECRVNSPTRPRKNDQNTCHPRFDYQ